MDATMERAAPAEAVDVNLAFDASAHEYRLAGHKVPSVTQVINAILPGWQASEWHKQRGRALHHGCALADKGVLDWATVSPEIEPRLRAWLKFRAEAKADVVAIERKLGSRAYQFAGTLDRLLVICGGGERVLCDLKSTIEEPQILVQLGGYSLLLPPGEKVRRAVGVELKADGNYSTRWVNQHELRRAEHHFLAVLTTFNLKKGNHG